MRLAVLSDVHGNLPALEAVLADLDAQRPDAIVVLGDHVSGPVDPAGTAARLMALGAQAISGNHDRWTLDLSLRGAGRVDRFARGRLDDAQMAWLAGLRPTTVIREEVFACHGTPGSDEVPWLDRFYDGRTSTLPTEAEVSREAVRIEQAVILCGHTHIPRSVRLADGRLIVNPGSVGMQFVRGSPDAHYAMIEKRRAGWQASLIGVPYDSDAAAKLAETNGFPGWAKSIRSGWGGLENLD